MHEHHISIPRTAHFFTLGTPGDHIRQVWYVMHGYGQLAARFIREFRRLDNGTRLIVAPEALSRFYIAGTNGHVGASWMTKDDRLAEIADYTGYLDALHRKIMEELDQPQVEIVVLGFSQGAATAARWAVNGGVDAKRLILWGGMMPPDVDLQEERTRINAMNLTLVLGSSDEYADAERTAAERERLAREEIDYRWIDFDGGHRIDTTVLRELASGTTVRST